MSPSRWAASRRSAKLRPSIRSSRPTCREFLASESLMTVSLYSLVSDAKALLELEPEELAGVLMEHLNSLPPSEQRQQLNRYNFGLPHTVQEYPKDQREALSQALMEAWVWLEREGLLVPRPGEQGEWVVISRRGQKLRTRDEVDSYRQADCLPRKLLHSRIAQKVSPFLRGDYEMAVFQAFKEVEVEVRKVAKCADADIGVPLMWKAFGEGGPLVDATAPKAEQQALAHLFAGAIGSYKNPHSHRSVTIESTEAAEMIVLASHLLGIVGQALVQRFGCPTSRYTWRHSRPPLTPWTQRLPHLIDS